VCHETTPGRFPGTNTEVEKTGDLKIIGGADDLLLYAVVERNVLAHQIQVPGRCVVELH
jgi:hypothetical protein